MMEIMVRMMDALQTVKLAKDGNALKHKKLTNQNVSRFVETAFWLENS